MEMLLQHPGLGPLWRRGKRRYVMRHFPYALIYVVSGEEIRILAVAHHGRRPGYWRSRNVEPRSNALSMPTDNNSPGLAPR